MSTKPGLHIRGKCNCSSDGSYQDERCAWFEEGAEFERSLIVADLRNETSKLFADHDDTQATKCARLADRYESGAHAGEGKP